MFERSDDHEILHHLLSAAAPGELIGYAAMKEATGKDVTGATPVLQSVLHRLLSEDDIVFQNERNVGYRRLTPEETVDAAEGDRARLHRHAHRNGRKLSTVDGDFATLDPEHRLRYATTASLFHAIAAATTKNALRLLERQVARTDARPLPFVETLTAFLGRKPPKEEE